MGILSPVQFQLNLLRKRMVLLSLTNFLESSTIHGLVIIMVTLKYLMVMMMMMIVNGNNDDDADLE